MTLLAEEVPIGDRKGAATITFDLELLGALHGAGIVPTLLANAGQVALHVGQKHRHAIG